MKAAVAARASETETRNAELLAGLGSALHEMSQPMTVLLCALEYAGGMESSAEMKEMIGAGTEACARLSESVRTMQMRVRRAAEGDCSG